MRIRPEQLESALERGIQGPLLISGEEILLVQEAADSFRSHCRQDGFVERDLHHVGKGFDWAQLAAEAQCLSLFADKKLVELRFEVLPDEPGKKYLARISAESDTDTRYLLLFPRIQKSTLNTKWFKTLEQAGVHLQIWPVTGRDLPAWISRQLSQRNMRATKEAIALLAQFVEGNLLAAHQEIEKLAILHDPGLPVEETTVLDSVAASSRYTVFDLSEAALAGQPSRVLRIVHGIEAESTAPAIVLWGLMRDVRLLGRLKRLSRDRTSEAETLLTRHGILPRNRPLYQAAARRCSGDALMQAHRACMEIEHSIKGLNSTSPWILLQSGWLALAGIQLPTGEKP